MWSKVVKTAACWTWPGADNGNAGHGQIRVRGKTHFVHRMALEEALKRRLRPGEHSLHVCDNPPCVRNDGEEQRYIVNGIAYRRFGHLWLGDHAANMADMMEKRRQQRRAQKLNAETVRLIRLSANTETQQALAERFGITQATVHAVIYRKTWADVT